jgi:hypothetical protein
MDQSENTIASEHADAFGPVALATFALNPSGAHLFRAQHEHILRTLANVTDAVESGLAGARGVSAALAAREALTIASSMLSIHQSLEDSLVRRALAAEPRMRLVVDQFEREMAPLVSEMASIARRYPTPSSILKNAGEFALAFSSLLSKLQERFRAEERELLSAFDRTARVGAPGGALLEAA